MIVIVIARPILRAVSLLKFARVFQFLLFRVVLSLKSFSVRVSIRDSAYWPFH